MPQATHVGARDVAHAYARAIRQGPPGALDGYADGIDYLTKLPDGVPPGRVLVHNQVRPTRRLGSRGFRAWLAQPDPIRLAVCDCGWAPELGEHFRVRANDMLRG